MSSRGSTQPSPDYVFTTRSLQACLERAQQGAWLPDLSIPADGTWLVSAQERDGVIWVIHADDSQDVSRIVVIAQGAELLGPTSSTAYRTVFERIHRLVLEAEHPPISLPVSWSEFRADNRIAYFASPRTEGALRWVAEIHPLGSADIGFWKITSPDDQVDLASFRPPYARYERIIDGWEEAYAESRTALADVLAESPPETVQPTVDLAETTFGAVTRYRTYSMWLGELTDDQRGFLEAKGPTSVKLRGPAGSGKTLVLELKALEELYSARDRGEELRILFTTHSWAMADQVDSALRSLDESGDLSSIDVYPLISIAQSVLPAERSGMGFQLLGEDSLSGKREQIRLINDILDVAVASDWLLFADRTSEVLRTRVEAPRDSHERNSLVWDLMLEFASVLSAHGILPGINAERQYLGLQRTPWMMPLETDSDKVFVLLVYSRYVESLREEGMLTTDQLINDFLNYLETFAWNIRRKKDGYDLLLVDELHLFSEQERLVLHYLTRSAEQYPRMYMALDPRQSPAEIYMDVGDRAITRGESGVADEYLGNVEAVELDTVHRFTPEILGLVRHVNQSYPALGLGDDWRMDLGDVESSAPAGSTPRLVTHATFSEEVTSVIERAAELAREAGDERVAVIVLEPLLLSAFANAAREGGLNVSIIEGRDDVETLQYARRSTIIGGAEFLAGLQFGAVLVAGLPAVNGRYANLGHQRRRFLSLLYLAVSRATDQVEIHVNDEHGGVPEILESAADGGLVATS